MFGGWNIIQMSIQRIISDAKVNVSIFKKKKRPHLHLHLKAIIKSSPQDEVA